MTEKTAKTEKTACALCGGDGWIDRADDLRREMETRCGNNDCPACKGTGFDTSRPLKINPEFAARRYKRAKEVATQAYYEAEAARTDAVVARGDRAVVRDTPPTRVKDAEELARQASRIESLADKWKRAAGYCTVCISEGVDVLGGKTAEEWCDETTRAAEEHARAREGLGLAVTGKLGELGQVIADRRTTEETYRKLAKKRAEDSRAARQSGSFERNHPCRGGGADRVLDAIFEHYLVNEEALSVKEVAAVIAKQAGVCMSASTVRKHVNVLIEGTDGLCVPFGYAQRPLYVRPHPGEMVTRILQLRAKLNSDLNEETAR
jgi:hypothetical protein